MIHYYNKKMTNAEIIGPITRSLLAAEIWVRCFKFPLYEISTIGRIRRAHTRQLVKPTQAGNGYLSVRLDQLYAKQAMVKVARLVTDAFFKRQDGYNLDHINGNRALNALFNVRYITASENQRNRCDSISVEWNGQQLNLMTAIEAVFGSYEKSRYQYILKRVKAGATFTDAAIQRATFETSKRGKAK